MHKFNRFGMAAALLAAVVIATKLLTVNGPVHAGPERAATISPYAMQLQIGANGLPVLDIADPI